MFSLCDKKFISRLLIFTLLCGGALYTLTHSFLGRSIPLICYSFYIYFFCVHLFIHHKIVKANQKSNSRFIATFMTTLGAKLFISLVCTVILGITYQEDWPVILIFSTLYFLYTIFEVISIIPIIRKTRY